jgi:hypothetical protein
MHRGMAARSLAFALAAAATIQVAAPAHAQYNAPAIDRPGSELRNTQPSLRLATLGGMSLAIADENNEINLWDFAGSSLGLLTDRDSTSLDVFFDSRSTTDQHSVGAQDRELLRARRYNLGMQAVGRTPGKFAAGLDAGYVSLGTRFPIQDDQYLDRSATVPLAIPTLNGRFAGGNLGWGAHLTFAGEAINDDRRLETIDGNSVQLQNGNLVNTPTPFIPNEGKTRVGGFGIGVGFFGLKNVDVAINWDRISNRVRDANTNARRVYETEERLASSEFSFATIVHPGWITFGGQVGTRKYDSKEEYRFSLSGGLNGPPLTSRGDRLFRDFEQRYLRARVALEPPGIRGLTVGADLNVRYDREDVAPATGRGNFNTFQQEIASDTLGIAPAVVDSRDELRHVNEGVGLGYRVTSRVLLGVEGHRYRSAWNGTLVSAREVITELRGGVEFAVTPAWTGRLGGYHRSDDADQLTANNETVSNALTAGVGWTRPKSRHQLDAGVEVGKRSSNYPDPTDENGSTFRLVLYNRWAF